MDLIGTPSWFQSTVWTFVRHTVSRCLIFPALPEMTKVTWVKSQSILVASSSSLPTGQYGLCFGNCFSDPLPLRSHLNSPPFGVCFGDSQVLIDYTQKSTRSTLAFKLSVAPPVYIRVTATVFLMNNHVFL